MPAGGTPAADGGRRPEDALPDPRPGESGQAIDATAEEPTSARTGAAVVAAAGATGATGAAVGTLLGGASLAGLTGAGLALLVLRFLRRLRARLERWMVVRGRRATAVARDADPSLRDRPLPELADLLADETRLGSMYEANAMLRAARDAARMDRLIGEARARGASPDDLERLRLDLADRAARREQHYGRLRVRAATARVLGGLDAAVLRRSSPEGAYWLLDRDARTHTQDCSRGDAVIDAPLVGAISRRWYVGPMVEVQTRGGRLLAVTPNHPVLTGEGWIAAGSLDVGDDLVSHAWANGRPGGQPHGHDVPPTIEEVFDLAAVGSHLVRHALPVGPEDFHGDGGRGEVEVVRPDRPLRLHRESGLAERVPHGLLPRRRCGLCGFERQRGAGGACPGGAVVLDAPQRDAGGEQPVGQRVAGHAEVGGEVEHGAPAGVGAHGVGVGRCDAGQALARGEDDAGRALLADAELARELAAGGAGPVAMDEIVGVEVVWHEGWVYNLSTEGRWYAIDSLVTHNCVVMAGRAYPWEVLDVLRPPVGPGCRCSLRGLPEARRRGWLGRAGGPVSVEVGMALIARARAIEAAGGGHR